MKIEQKARKLSCLQKTLRRIKKFYTNIGQKKKNFKNLGRY